MLIPIDANVLLDSNEWPSYLRIMIVESNVLEPGTLLVVGSQGALIGSGVKCIIRLEDIDVVRKKVKIFYQLITIFFDRNILK